MLLMNSLSGEKLHPSAPTSWDNRATEGCGIMEPAEVLHSSSVKRSYLKVN